ncbi:MAG: HAMP domain-containing histidine kinase, partial [Actinomycetota bacterium]|nr:HAMP domain-containing histidine kinase [Actinomycetota bacterium]
MTALFTAGALGVSAAVAAGSYQLTRSALVQERERTAVRATWSDAVAVQEQLSTEDPDLVEVLRTLDTGSTRRPLIHRDGQWYARSTDDGITAAIPANLQEWVAQDRPAAQRVRIEGTPTLVVAVPLASATYYGLTDLSELDGTLRSLSLILSLVALATSLAGAALGWWAGRRVLRPMTSVTEAATSIAAGDLSARLDPAREPDLARLTASFNTMVDALQARLERDRRFAADVSHELRSPLQTLSAAAEVLERRRDRLDPRTGAALGLLTGEVARFGDLVSDLLQLSRGDRPAERRPVDVPALVREVCAPRGVPVEGLPGLVAEVDQARVRQTLVNLLDNAERHGGGVVAVRVLGDESCVAVEVDDAGPGVPVEERELVFDRFARGRAASARRDSEGTGLGLA